MHKDQIIESFEKYYKRLYGKKTFEKNQTQIKKLVEDTLKKLNDANFISYAGNIASNVNYESIEDFVSDLRHIKKSKERLVRYGIFYLFKTGEPKISLESLSNTLEKFELKNLKQIVEKLIENIQSEKFDIVLDNESIIIKHRKSDPEVAKILLSDTLFFSRRSPGSLADVVIDLLEYNSLSGKEISDITGTDKGHISKIINSLLEEKLITHSDFSGNSRYYTTNCKNCPYNRDKDDCSTIVIAYIQRVLKDELGIVVDDVKLKEFDLHSLRNLEKMLKLTFIDSNKLEKDLAKLQKFIFNSVVTQLDKKTPTEVQKLLPKLPMAYQTGIEHGALIASKIQVDIVTKALKPLLKAPELKKFTQRYIEQLNKYGKIAKF